MFGEMRHRGMKRLAVLSFLLLAEGAASALDGSSAGTSAEEIAKQLIADSISSYPGPCACPYQNARNGSSCGKRAAYVRPGGYAPLCFAKDITPEMVANYRASH